MLQSGSFDLLITDYQMPGLTGLELIRMVRQASMSVPIILTSGMLGTLSLDEQPLLDCRAVLAKPFTPEQLITLVQDVLPAKPGLKHTQPTPGKMD